MARRPRAGSGRGTPGERSVEIGRDLTNSTIITGDRNTVKILSPPVPVLRLTRATWRAWLRAQATPVHIVAVLVALVGLVSGVLVIYQFARPVISAPRAMTGTFNVAIAEFAGLDSQGREIDLKPAASLAEDVSRALEQELKPSADNGVGPSEQIWSPAQTGRIRGSTPELRAAAAGQRAREINADVLVYGDIATGPRGTTFRPELYLASKKLHDAEELGGTHDLGAPIQSDGDVGTNTATREKLGNQLLERTRALGQFVLGLDAFEASQYDRAATYFDAAAEQAWIDNAGMEVVYLFQGNAAGRRNDLAAAQQYYDLALQERPDSQRGKLGQAEVLFQRSGAHEGCKPDSVNAPDLLAAINAFEALAEQPGTPGSPNVRTKANFGLGRAYVCLSSAEADHWSDAQRAYSAVIADFEQGTATDREGIRDLAAEAHAGLGYVALPASDEPAGESRAAEYQAAAAEYQRAIDLTGHGERRAVFYVYLAHVHERLGDFSSADNDYVQAASADPQQKATYEALRQRLREHRE